MKIFFKLLMIVCTLSPSIVYAEKNTMADDVTSEELNLLINVWMQQDETMSEYYMSLETSATAEEQLEQIRNRMELECKFVETLQRKETSDPKSDILTSSSQLFLLDNELPVIFREFTTAPTVAQLQRIYNAESSLFRYPEKRVVRYVTFPVEFGDKNEAEVKKQAEAVRHQIISGEKTFDEIADEMWNGKEGDGRLKPFDNVSHRGLHTQVAFSMEPGEVSSVVRSKIGYHLFYLIRIIPSGVLPFEQVEPVLNAEFQQRFSIASELEFYRKSCAGCNLSAPFLDIYNLSDITTATVLYKVNGNPEFTVSTLQNRIRELVGSQPVSEDVYLSALASYFRRECLQIPSVRQAALKLPKIRKMIHLIFCGERAKQWRDLHLKVPEPTEKQIEAFYKNNIKKLYSNPTKYWATILRVEKPPLQTFTNRDEAYRAIGEWEDLRDQITSRALAGYDLHAIAAAMKPKFNQLILTPISGEGLQDTPRLFTIPADIAPIGKIYGPVEAKTEFMFVNIHKREEGEPKPLSSVKPSIVQHLRSSNYEREWQRVLLSSIDK
jgi:hypothetical protein